MSEEDYESCESCYIVDPSTLMSEKEILDESYDFKGLPKSLQKSKESLSWLATRGLIRNCFKCPNCKKLCRLEKIPNGIDCTRWRCSKCGLSKSIRNGTIFSRSHLTISQIMQLMIGWANELEQDCVEDTVGVSKKTVSFWYDRFRTECSKAGDGGDGDDLEESEKNFRKSVDDEDKVINHFLLLLRENRKSS